MRRKLLLSLFASGDSEKMIWPVITDRAIFIVGDEYPEAEIQGIDLSPIQPQWVPPNVQFMVDDAEAEWLFPAESLDYIHIRHMTSSIRDWPTLLSRAYR
jgi:hypothetical protein